MSTADTPGGRTAARSGAASLAAPLLAAVLAAVTWGAFLGHVASVSFGGDVRGLLLLSEARPHPAAMAGIPRTATKGYDGQYYAALAADPFLLQDETVAALDNPPYRSLRIGVPLAAWLASLGRPAPATVAYQILCWLGAACGVFLLARWLAAVGASPWWALAVALGAGTLTSVLRCTPDAAAVALCVAALLAHRRGRLFWAVALAAAATLVRETSWLAAAAIAVAELVHGRRRAAFAAAAAPLLPLAAWIAWMSRTVGGLPLGGQGSFAEPLAWVAAKAGQLGEPLSPNPVEVVGVAAIVAMLLSPLALLRRTSFADSAAVTYLLFAALAWSLGWAVWSDAHAFSRVLLPVAFLAPVLAAHESDRARRALLLGVPVTLLVVGAVMAKATLDGASAHQPGGSTARPDQSPIDGETFFVLGAARTRGASGAMWRTDVEFSNPLPAAVTVTVEALPTDLSRRPHTPARLRLRPRETRRQENVLESLVPFYGVVALRLVTDRPGVAIRWTTYLESEPRGSETWNRALPLEGAFGYGNPARLAGLEHDPHAGSRTDLAVLNVCDRRIELHIGLSSAAGRRAAFREFLEPRQFVQLHDVFGGMEPAPGPGAEATVSSKTPGGAFLVRATVVRPGAGPAQVEAQPRCQDQNPPPGLRGRAGGGQSGFRRQ